MRATSVFPCVLGSFARHVQASRPHLRFLPLPFELEGSGLELLWSRVTGSEAASGFVREAIANILGS